MATRVAIVGLGLIGGSLALSLKRAGGAWHVIGIDSDARTRELALRAGAADQVAPLETADLSGVSLAMLATPPAVLVEQIEPVARRLGKGAVLTDVCGAKEEVCRRGSAQRAAIFVGGHPMAGTEFRGFEAARPTLFDGAVVALCPGAAPRDSIDRVAALWRGAGAASIIELDPEAHDRAVTFASHLPYLAAASVVEALISSGAGEALARELAAGGFRDTTRVAGDWTLSGAAALNRFLPAAARELAGKLSALADELRRDPASAVDKLRALADDRRAMKLPPPPGSSK